MNVLSVCSGIEAASVAWNPLGWKSIGFAEIDKFPSAVLAHHYPEVKNYGDFTKIQLEDLPCRPDILVGGTPCQSFSVAGLRAGLDDPRGNLTLEFARLADRLRPRWLVWENVPGVLSIDGGRTFGAFLGALGKVGYGFAYRVLNAEHFGVPQKRRRVFVVGYLGDWRCAAAVLFERHSLQGNSPPSREKRKSAPTIPSRRTAGGGYGAGTRSLGTDFGCDGGLIPTAFGGNNTSGPIDIATACNAHGGPNGRLDFESETFIAHSLRADGFDASEDGTGRGTPLVPVGSFQYVPDIAATLRSASDSPAAHNKQNGTDRVDLVAFSCKDSGLDSGEISPTLRGMGHSESHANAGGQVAVAIGLDEEQNAVEDGMGCLKARREGGGFEGSVATANGGAGVMAVRRLTPC